MSRIRQIFNFTTRKSVHTSINIIPKIKKVKSGTNTFEITWDNGNSAKFPLTLLRDMCKCESCFHKKSHQRTFIFSSLNLDELKVIGFENDQNNDQLIINWTCENMQHTGIVKNTQLLHHQELCKNGVYGSDILRSERVLWHSSKTKLPVVSFNEIKDPIKSKNSIRLWITMLIKYGMVKITDMPVERNAIYKFSECVSYFKKTNYGEIFNVETKPTANNLAYTSGYIPPHIDLPYWDHVPGVQILHTIIQSENGGESTLVDGASAALELRNKDENAFNTLCSVKCVYENVGKDTYGDYYLQKAVPLIEMESDGKTIKRLNEGNFQRSFFVGTPEEIDSAYRAYPKFFKILTDPERVLKFTLKPGEMITFDNTRVLHGREAFPSNQSRLLQGGYFDWDELLSKLRTL